MSITHAKALISKHHKYAWVFTLSAVLAVGGIYFQKEFAQAATYTWNQTSFSSGQSTDTAIDTRDRTSWTKYSATSTIGITATSSVSLSFTPRWIRSAGLVSTSPGSIATGGAFSVGTRSSTTITGTGSGSSVELKLTNTAKSMVAGGASSAYALDSKGAVWAWGDNASGRLGNGTIIDSHIPTRVSTPAGIASIAAAYASAYALENSGAVLAWGDNASGQLGNGTTTDSYIPTRVSTLAGIASIAAASASAYALDNLGAVWAWGENSSGQLGNNSTTTSSLPVRVSATVMGAGVKAISGGSASAYALDSNGAVWAWGENNYAQLGNGTTANSFVPISVSTSTGMTGAIKAISGGTNSAYAIDDSGAVWSWGSNANAQLGRSTPDVASRQSPGKVSTSTGMINPIKAISASINPGIVGTTVYALDSTGAVWAWGLGTSGQMGVNSTSGSSLPVKVSAGTGMASVTGISAGFASAYAIDSNGVVWAWGDNASGKLGNNSLVDQLVPIKTYSALPTGVFSARTTNATTSLAGGLTSAYAIDSADAVWAWGDNVSGKLGNGNTTDRNTPVSVTNSSSFIALAAGDATTYALDNSGAVWAWGYGFQGQRGDGSQSASSTPIKVSAINMTAKIKAISAGSDSAYAIDSADAVWAWGYNVNGELGNGTTTNSLIPIKVSAINMTAKIKAISGGTNSAYAIDFGGVLWAWGNNPTGQLGNGTITDSLSPTKVSTSTGMTNPIKAISGGLASAYALDNSGAVWSWGTNTSTVGQLGRVTADAASKQSPGRVSTTTMTRAITAIDSYGGSAYAIDDSGDLWSWGLGTSGQMGNGLGSNSPTPTKVTTTGMTKPIMAISAGATSAYAIDSAGAVWVWGSNLVGQLGDNTITQRNSPVKIKVYTATDVLNIGIDNYVSSGTFVSGVIDLGAILSPTKMVVSSSTPSGATITMKVTGSANGSTWSATSTVDAVGNLGIASARYIRYEATLLPNVAKDKTPTLDSVKIEYNQYALLGDLTSSKYDSNDPSSAIGGISWDETATSGQVVTVSLRTASTSALLADATSPWTPFASTTSGCLKTGITVTCNHDAIPAEMEDVIDGKWLQYKIGLTGAGDGTPTVSAVRVSYGSNAAPIFDTTYNTTGVTAVQVLAGNGKVNFSYRLSDSDSFSFTPSFQYSADGSTNWTRIPPEHLTSGVAESPIEPTSVLDGYTATTTFVVWNAASTTSSNLSTTTAKIRVTVNDGNTINGIASAVSGGFDLDTKAPTVAAGNFKIDSSTRGLGAGTVLLTADDMSTMQYRLCNVSTFPTGGDGSNTCAWSMPLVATPLNVATTTFNLTGATSTETVYMQVSDKYGNIISGTATAPAMLANFIFSDVTNLKTPTYREYLDWSSFSGIGFGSYEVWHATTTTTTAPADGAYKLVSSIASSTDSFYTHTIPSSDKLSTQYYKVRLKNTNGDISNFTGIVSDIPDGIGGTGAAITPVIPTLELSGERLRDAYSVAEANTRFSSGVQFSTTNAVSVTVNGLATTITNDVVTAEENIVAKALGTHIYNITVTSSTGHTSSLSIDYLVNADSIIPVLPTLELSGERLRDAYSVAEANTRFSSGVQFSTTNAVSVTVNGLATTITNDVVTAEENIVAKALGTHIYNITVTSSTGHTSSLSISYTVNDAIDNTSPEITLYGDNPMSIILGTTYNDPGAWWTDNSTGTATSSVTLENILGSVISTVRGIYTLTYQAFDTSKNMGLTTRTVNVDYAPAYYITASAGANGTINPSGRIDLTPEGDQEYTFTPTTPDYRVASLIVDDVRLEVSDTYTFRKVIRDHTIEVTFALEDRIPPVITLNGGAPNGSDPENPVLIALNGTYAELGATVTDNVDTGLVATVVGKVNTRNIGTSTISYFASDRSGNTTSAERTVVVFDAVPPTIKLIGADPLNIDSGTIFVDPGATALGADGITPVDVVISGMVVSTEVAGTYTVVYTATEDGITASVTRTVIVDDKTPPRISEISVPIISSSLAVIVWQTNETATTQVIWGTSPTTLDRTTILETSKSIYHVVTLGSGTDDKLTASTKYYFKVRSADKDGNVSESEETSEFSSTEGAVAIIPGPPIPVVEPVIAIESDTTNPVVSNVKVTGITPFSTTVTFDTDEDVVAFVEYGKDDNYGDTAGSKNYAKTHTVKLRGLSLGTEYNIKVSVNDKAGNEGTSDNQTFKTSFLTDNIKNLVSIQNIEDFQKEIEDAIESILPSLVPPFVSKPQVTDITEDSATVTFKTNIKTFPVVGYVEDSEYDSTQENPYISEISDITEKSVSHTLNLLNLKPNTKYRIQARAFSLPQVIGESDGITFTTKAPRIAGSIVERKKDSFTVVWTTLEPTTSIVEYKDSKRGIAQRKTSDAMKTAHSMKIENLPSGTTYSVDISGLNVGGNVIEAGSPLSVTTSTDTTPPTITGFKVDNALVPGRTDRIQTIVSWTTSEPANGTVYYEEGAGSAGDTKELANKIESLGSYTIAHSVIIPSLKPGTIYRLKVASSDDSGNEGSFGPRTVITPKQTESITDIIFKNFEDSFKFLKKI